MAGSAYYTLWLHDGTTWVQAPNIVGLRWNTAVNMVGGMSVTLYTKNAALQALLKAGTPYRIMNKASTSGFAFNEAGGTAGNFVIQSGSLDEPSSDEKTSTTGGGLPVIWSLSGNEMAEDIMKMTFDNTVTTTDTNGTTQIAQQLSGGVGQMFKRSDNNANFGIVDNLNSALHGRPGTTVITSGTIDTGPTATVKFRQDNAYQMMLDLAAIGDSPTQFSYYVLVGSAPTGSAPNIKYIPKVNYISSQNGTYVQPNGLTGVRYGDPTSGTPDTTRIIEELRHARSVNSVLENDRIKNAINIKYSGSGSTDGTGNSGQLETGFGLNASSITAFGRREATLSLPWVQSSATATTMRATLLNVYSGLPNGIQRVEITLRKGALYDAAGFNANLGDTIALKRKNGTYIIGKFLLCTYDQSGEALTVVIGLPSMGDSSASIADLAAVMRSNQQQVTSLERTSFRGLVTSATNAVNPESLVYQGTCTVTLSDSTLNSSPTAMSSTTINSSDSADKAGYLVFVNGTTTSANINGSINFLFSSDIELFGPLLIEVTYTDANGTRSIYNTHIETIVATGTDIGTYSYPFALSDVDSQINPANLKVKIYRVSSCSVNGSPSGPWQDATVNFTVKLYGVDAPVIDASHVHNA